MSGITREMSNEFFVSEFALEAEDMLHIVREMGSEQRIALRGDLIHALGFIAQAIKESYDGE